MLPAANIKVQARLYRCVKFIWLRCFFILLYSPEIEPEIHMYPLVTQLDSDIGGLTVWPLLGNRFETAYGRNLVEE
jgi:hypothetical protein